MKRSIFIVATSIFTLFACKKSTDGNKGVLAEESAETEATTTDATKPKEQSFLYSGLNKTKAKVTFINTEKEKTMIIEANEQKFMLDKKSETLYERSGIKAEIKGDSLYIIQDDNVIPLKKTF